MTAPSIRVRLTAWYVGVLSVATLTLAGATWWLSTESVVSAADVSLRARIAGVGDFLENPTTRLAVADLRDEFAEYAELTRGEALLEVVDGTGTVLCRPSTPGWDAMTASLPRGAAASGAGPADRRVGALPYRVAWARIPAHGQVYAVTVAAPMGPAYAALARFHRWLIVLLPGVIAVAALGGYWISRRALAPVDQITRAVQSITLERLDRRLELPAARDELRRLAVTFNEVIGRLEAAVGDIVRFTADASHELRTPVSVIRTTADLALRHERSPEDYRQALGEIAGQARQMTELVEDLLVLARIDAGIEPPGAARVDLREVAAEAARDVAEAAAARSVHVCLRTGPAAVVVRGDRVALRRLIVALLDNAVKYSPAGGRVEIEIAVDPSRAQASLEVRDRGIGLDPAEADRLFERFYRGARARAHTPHGTGLGLAIARTIVEQHGGRIDLAATESSGGGCRVRVTLIAEVL